MDCIIHARNVEEMEIDSKMDVIRKMEDYVESQGVKIPKLYEVLEITKKSLKNL